MRNAGGVETTTAPRARAETRAPRATLALICTGYFIVILDATVTNVALPSIGRGLHASVAGLQWVVDAYTLAFTAGLVSVSSAFVGGMRIGLVIAACAFLAGAARPARSAGNRADLHAWPSGV
jgi:MFS transporter, DHA2 family, methylenomycin A resistance protein